MKTAATAKGRQIKNKPGRPTGKSAVVPTLYEQFKAFDGRADDLPADLAHQHDHYLYGTAKRVR